MCIKYVIYHKQIWPILSYDVYKRLLYNLIKQNNLYMTQKFLIIF